MRIGLILASLALLSAWAPAGLAAPEEPKAKPAARAKLPTNLRGSQAPQAPAAPEPKPAPRPLIAAPGPFTAVAQPSLPGASSRASAKPDIGQCRTSCAHTYYFCLSSSGNTDCSDTWGQCLSRCSYPPAGIDR